MNKELTNEQIAAQLIFPRLEVEKYFRDEEYKEDIQNLVRRGVGGFCVFWGGLVETPRMISELQKIASTPLLFCSDFEHGLAMRLQNGTAFPHALAMGMNPQSRTKEIASAIATESRSIGIMWNLAPVCDINSNKYNPVINIRSFGNNIEIVNARSADYIEGTQSEKVIATAKHFPGHGDTETDSHLSLPVLNHSSDRIRDFELAPFENAIGRGVKSIMVGHLAVPAITGDNTPASLSYSIVTDLLRDDLSFEGLIVTDALDMKAITDNYPEDVAVLMALEAGNDVLLLPPNPNAAIDALAKKFENSPRIKAAALESVSRIFSEKSWCGLREDNFEYMFRQEYFEKHERLALEESFDAIKVISGGSRLLPLNQGKQIAGFAFMQGEDVNPGALFFKYFAQAIECDCDFAFVDENITNDEIDTFKSSVRTAEIMLFAFFLNRNTRSDNEEFAHRINSIVERFADNRPVVAVVFGNPNAAEMIRANEFVLTFSDSLPSIAAAIVKLSGRGIE